MAENLHTPTLELMRKCHENNLKFNDIFPEISDDYIELFQEMDSSTEYELIEKGHKKTTDNLKISDSAYQLLDKLHRQNIYGKHKIALERYQKKIENVEHVGQELSKKGLAILTQDKGAIALDPKKRTEIEEILSDSIKPI